MSSPRRWITRRKPTERATASADRRANFRKKTVQSRKPSCSIRFHACSTCGNLLATPGSRETGTEWLTQNHWSVLEILQSRCFCHLLVRSLSAMKNKTLVQYIFFGNIIGKQTYSLVFSTRRNNIRFFRFGCFCVFFEHPRIIKR